ncbi:MAG: hypothetical protein L3J28_00090 [Candidatus Polarisedimenticolaceae bacterium]|nr:hypothetical protein [Candidatus Polarisedimenticolaceae bacterium]
MTQPQHDQQPHKSVQIGVYAMMLGLVGSAIAYLGLWLESDMMGLVGFCLVGIAIPGALISLFWSVLHAWRNRGQPE